jgi:hypothetical protein
MDDYQLNWDDINDLLFINFLSKYYSGKLFLFGEDEDDKQQITMQANGEYKIDQGTVVYGDLINAIIERYELPEKLKQDLLNYKLARKI